MTVLNYWSVFADIASMQVSNFLAPSATAIANSTWTNSSFPAQNGAFQADWDAMPTASGMDGVIALSSGPQTDFFGFACLVRFYSVSGTIQARNGGSYMADTTLFYTPNLMYHFRLVINVPSHIYSVYVTASGGSEQLLASNYAFRTEQAGVTALNSVGMIVDTSIGSLRFGNFAVSNTTAGAYDQTVLGDRPVAFWDLTATAGTEADLTGNGNTGTYIGGEPSVSTMPNGDQVAVFNGSSEYLNIPSNSNGSFSIPTTKYLTWEVWIRPDVLQFPHSDGTGDYVDVMGKCANYSPTCEWESRMYNTNTPGEPPPPRSNRMSAYVFNPSAMTGSGADWQPVSGLIQAGQWLHIVGEYTTDPSKTPADCANGATYPGSINIWVNGVLWNQSVHGQTGCMGQFSIIPKANNSPLNIGTMATDAWFEGAIGKVAIYNYLLTQSQITNHYQTMTGKQPSGSCGTQGTCTF
ncbi:MAG: LamG-like jellyroll fold domain-containing protein [Candidatus Angelobacter sp.]